MGGERIPSLRWGSFATAGRNKQNKKRLPRKGQPLFYSVSDCSEKR